MNKKHQLPSQVIDIANWKPDSEYEGVYPKGARDKTALFCPYPSPYPFLISGHSYLYKLSFRRYPDQFWHEIFAYRLGCLMSILVPPTFVAYDSAEKTCGALSEWFYKRDQKTVYTDYIDGGNFMRAAIKDYDSKTGIQHNFETILKLAQKFEELGYSLDKLLESWAKIITFDSLIGNTDRHHDNWGVLFQISLILIQGRKPYESVQFSPAFDNGTSMGHEIIERDFPKFDNPIKIKNYVEKGCHHMKWTLNDSRRMSHAGFLKRFMEDFPAYRKIILKCLSFNNDAIKREINELMEFDIPIKLSKQRADFIIKLILYRKEKLMDILKKI